MNWKEIGETLRKRRQSLGYDIKYVAYSLGISMNRVIYIEEGRFDEVDDPIFVKTYIKRYADLLGLDGEELARRYWESVTGKKEERREVKEKKFTPKREMTFDLVTMILLIIAVLEAGMAFYLYNMMDRIRSEPVVYIKNVSGKDITVNGKILKDGEIYVVEDEAEVVGNEGTVIVKSFGKEPIEVKDENFKVVVRSGIAPVP